MASVTRIKQPADVLQSFEGKPEEAIKLEVTKTGNGLEASLEIAPVRLEIGDRAGVLILGPVTKIRHEPHKYKEGEASRDGVDRVQILETEGAIVLPADSPELNAVRRVIAEIKLREQAKRDAKRQQMTIDVDPTTKASDDEETEDEEAGGEAGGDLEGL